MRIPNTTLLFKMMLLLLFFGCSDPIIEDEPETDPEKIDVSIKIENILSNSVLIETKIENDIPIEEVGSIKFKWFPTYSPSNFFEDIIQSPNALVYAKEVRNLSDETDYTIYSSASINGTKYYSDTLSFKTLKKQPLLTAQDLGDINLHIGDLNKIYYLKIGFNGSFQTVSYSLIAYDYIKKEISNEMELECCYNLLEVVVPTFGKRNGEYEIYVGSPNSVSIYNAESLELVDKLELPTDLEVNSIAVHDNLVFVGTQGLEVMTVFDRETLQIINSTSIEHNRRATFVGDASNPDSIIILSGTSFTSNPNVILDIFSASGQHISETVKNYDINRRVYCTNGNSQYIHLNSQGAILDKDNFNEIAFKLYNNDQVRDAQFTPDGTKLITLEIGGNIKVYDTNDFSIIQMESLNYSPNSIFVLNDKIFVTEFAGPALTPQGVFVNEISM